MLAARPARLARDGDWPGARDAAERIEKSVLRFLPGVRSGMRYTRALCLHLEGRWDGSLDELANVPRSSAMRYARLTLETGNLVMAERDAARAAEAITEACTIHCFPEDLLLLALAKLALGDRAAADAAFARAGTTRPANVPSPRINEPVFHYLRGLYLVKTDRAGDARPDLEAAAHGPCPSVYVDRARSLLARASASGDADGADDADDARSSLAPQVIAAAAREDKEP